MIRPSASTALRAPRVLFSGGGTAGHLAPGFALAEALQARGIASVFATPGERGEEAWFAGRGRPHVVAAARIPTSLSTGIAFAPRMLRGVLDALAVIRRERPAAVVALGGWPCVPMALAARLVGVPLAFIVADNVPGMVVRKLGRLAGRIYVPTEAAGRSFDPTRVVVSGPLLRDGLVARSPDPAAFGLRGDLATLLVFGGSLGARGLYERWLLGLQRAVVEHPSLTRRIQILHAVGKQGDAVASTYARLGLVHHVTPYIQDMGGAYAVADLVLGRGGANTCAELLATRTPAVIVPYPHHVDRQQFKNAAALVEAGVGVVVEEGDLSPECVESEVLARLLDPAQLASMRGDATGPESDSTGQTADDLIRFLGMRTLRQGIAAESRADDPACRSET